LAKVQKTNNMPNFKKNTSPAMKRSGFKMKSSPAKNLGNFFGSIFSSKEIKGRQEAQRESNTGEYKGMTDLEKRRAEKKSRKAGESKFQADVRRKREKKAEAKKAEVKTSTQGFRTYGYDTGYEAPTAPETKPYVKSKSKIKVEAAIPWNKVPKVGTQARTNWYKKYNLELDETTPGYKSKKDVGGPGTFQGDPEKEHFGATSRAPLTKKSPYKKGIGSYAKKAKGSRGYKMKRK